MFLRGSNDIISDTSQIIPSLANESIFIKNSELSMGFKASVVVKEAILQYIFFLFLTRSAGFIIMLKVVGFFIQVDMFWDWQQKTHMALITSLKMTTTKIFKGTK